MCVCVSVYLRGDSTSHLSQSVTVGLSLTEPLCFLLMNSLISVLKRTTRVLTCLRAPIRNFNGAAD